MVEINMSALCHAETSQLVMIDIQQRLASAMPKKVMSQVLHNSGILLQAAKLLDVQVLETQQYPKGLGPTCEEVSQQLESKTARIEKTCFACTGSSDFTNRLSLLRRPQIILAGIETHICVLQTALELAEQGFRVFVVEDAVCSRNKHHHRNALARLRQAGIIVTNTESVLFEWLRDAQHEHFRQIAGLIK